MAKDREAQLAAFWDGVEALTPLPRAVYLMSGFDEKSYAEIAAWLDVDADVVRAAMIHAICVVAEAVRNQVPAYERPANVRKAEAALLRRYEQCQAALPFDDWLRQGGPAADRRHSCA